MSNGIMRELTNAVESRREANRHLIQAIRRLASRIVEEGRVGDGAHVANRVYAIKNAAWTLKDAKGREFETHPPVKTLAIYTGEFYGDENGYWDDRRLVSLLELKLDPKHEGTIVIGPHIANRKEVIREGDDLLGMEGAGPTEFERPTEADLEAFSQNAEKIVKEFIKGIRDEGQVKKQQAEKVIELAEEI